MTTKCPCCGTTVNKPILVDITANIISFGGIEVRVPTRWAEVMRIMVGRMPHPATTDQVIGALWAERDEPENIGNNVKVVISQLRHALVGSGLAIRTVYGVGYKLERADIPPDKLVVARASLALQEAASAR